MRLALKAIREPSFPKEAVAAMADAATACRKTEELQEAAERVRAEITELPWTVA
ncbi:MAG TPA: hypothetical protein VMW65_15865 [Chloroflexota bacterium]|nr:hypothetical protein [Chloroflexota bacterium]